MRKWPQAIWVDRYANEDVTLKTGYEENLRIEKGTVILIPIFPIQRDAQYFENPDIFNPERFNDKNLEHKAYIPFGLGPRNCIGMYCE